MAVKLNPNTSKARGGLAGGGLGAMIALELVNMVPWHTIPCFSFLADGSCDLDAMANFVSGLQSIMVIVVTAMVSYAGAWIAKANDGPSDPPPPTGGGPAPGIPASPPPKPPAESANGVGPVQ